MLCSRRNVPWLGHRFSMVSSDNQQSIRERAMPHSFLKSYLCYTLLLPFSNFLIPFGSGFLPFGSLRLTP